MSSGQLSGSRSLYITNFVKLKKPRKTLGITSHPFSWEIDSVIWFKYSSTPSFVLGISKSGISTPLSTNLACKEMLVIMSSPVQRSLKEPFTRFLSSSTGISSKGASLNPLLPFSSFHFKKPMARYRMLYPCSSITDLARWFM